MKHLKFLFLLLLLSVLVLPVQAKSKKYPVLEFETTKIDLGTFSQKTPKTVEFKFKNVGKKKFVLHELRTSCGCTTAKISKEMIKPGESGTVTVTYDGKGYSLGMFQKGIYILSNCEKAEIRLVITGEVTK